MNVVARYTDAKLGFTGENFSLLPADYPEALQSTQRNHNLYSRGEVVWSLFDGPIQELFRRELHQSMGLDVNPNPDFAANNGFARRWWGRRSPMSASG